MEKDLVIFEHDNGEVDGIYINAGSLTPLVIIVNGHNGFYNYGMFPYLQQRLLVNNISSYSFNYSHGGVKGDADIFEDLEKYERNCMRLETEDLLCVLRNSLKRFHHHSKVFLLAHSLGGIPALFGAKKAIEQNIDLQGIILASTVSTLNFWPADVLTEWASAGIYYKLNNRTKQNLPQGFEFLQEILKCDKNWNVQDAIQSFTLPILIIHGNNDEAVGVEHAESLFEWMNKNDKSQLKIIAGATHTYNTGHPFDKTSPELEDLINNCATWIHANAK